MTNLWLAGLVCVCCIAVGAYLRRKYRIRVDVWAELVHFLAYAEEQIRDSLRPLPAICADFAVFSPTPFGQAIAHFPELADLPQAGREWTDIRGMLLSLGRSDAEGQTVRIAYLRAQAEAGAAEAQAERRGKGDLYAKLCVVAGIGLMIWMV